jgi:hypothetical protein
MIEEIEIADLDPRQIKQLEGADRAIAKTLIIPSISTQPFSSNLRDVWNYANG